MERDNPLYKRATQEIEDRGYSRSEMEKIKQHLRHQQHEWERTFKSFVEQFLARLDTPPNDADICIIIQQAEKLTDAVLAKIDGRKNPALEEEE